MSVRIYLKNNIITAVYDKDCGGIVSLKSAYDDFKADFVLTPEEFPEYDVDDCKWLGNLEGKIVLGKETVSFSTGRLKKKGLCSCQENCLDITWPEIESEGKKLGFSMEMQFLLENELVTWTAKFENISEDTISFTEIAIPLLMNQYFRIDDDFKYDRCVMRHTCITGHSSYIYWEKSSGNAPVLLLAPLSDGVFTQLKQEKEDKLFGERFGDGFGYEGLVRAYAVDDSNRFSLRPGESKELKFCLAFINNETQINDMLNRLSLITMKAVPGMVGPINKDFYVMTRPVTAQVDVFGPEDCIIESRIEKGWRVNRIRFGAYGKRRIQVKKDGNIASYCFFITEPVRDMIDRHAAFVAKNHLETNEKDPCYHGLLMWDMVNKRRINSTFNPYFEDWWRGGSDDPGLASGLFLAEKNVYRASEEEVKVLNAYVEDFILKRLTEQPGWRVHRMVPWYTMFEPWAGRGADDVWRAFNYVHVINVMYDMYRIQKQHHYSWMREAAEYLKMAYEYTKAMFNYWMFPHGVGASEFGNMGEMTLPLYLAQALQKEGFVQEACEMAAIFDKKAHYFNSKQFPFGSEMVYDSTAFEAVYAYGKRIGSEHIMRAAAKASYSNRGKQPIWFLYNTDLRAGGDTSWNSSYMTQLGAFPILDYTLDQGHIDEDWILSYYGASLSGWLIYNSGGYWSPDRENQGATGWITIASLINHTGQPPKNSARPENGKLGMPLSKGCVILSGEAGIGFFGALRTACSIVMEHSVLGIIGLGCSVDRKDGKERISPEDGLSVRFYHVPDRWKVETIGGCINEIVVIENEIQLDMTSLCREGVLLKLYSIPQEGEKQRILFEEHIPAEENSHRLVTIPRYIVKSQSDGKDKDE